MERGAEGVVRRHWAATVLAFVVGGCAVPVPGERPCTVVHISGHEQTVDARKLCEHANPNGPIRIGMTRKEVHGILAGVPEGVPVPPTGGVSSDTYLLVNGVSELRVAAWHGQSWGVRPLYVHYSLVISYDDRGAVTNCELGRIGTSDSPVVGTSGMW